MATSQNMSHNVQTIKISPSVSCTSHPLLNPKILCFTMLFNRPDTDKSAPSWEASTSPCNTRSLDPHDSAFQTASPSVEPISHNSLQRVSTVLLYNMR